MRRDNGEGYRDFLKRLAKESGIEDPAPEDLVKLDRKRKKKGSNKEWVNPHDPDAKIAKMKDGRTHLAHKAEHGVDLDTGATLAVTLQHADRGDTQTLDTTLSEIMETLDEVIESIVIGQNFQGDARVVLFVKLLDGITLDAALTEKIRQRIREHTTPRHVPAKVVQVPDIPRTKSNKIVELAVRDVVHGRTVKNMDAMANPEALEFFRNRPELAN